MESSVHLRDQLLQVSFWFPPSKGPDPIEKPLFFAGPGGARRISGRSRLAALGVARARFLWKAWYALYQVALHLWPGSWWDLIL